MMKFVITLDRDEDGVWIAECPSIPGCISQGNSREEAEERHGRCGAHAYTADTKAMHTWLVVLGAGQGPLGPVALWDLAPTVATWLDIRWLRPPDGSPVPVLIGSH